MRPFTTRGPPADGYSLDRDLHMMTDDGGPHAPDPARWADTDWRDTLGEGDTFADEARTGFPDASRPGAGTVTVLRPTDLGPKAVEEPPSDGREAAGPGDRAGEDLRVTPEDPPPPRASVRVEGDAAAVWTARRSSDGDALDS
jgi:hypothetical protein